MHAEDAHDPGLRPATLAAAITRAGAEAPADEGLRFLDRCERPTLVPWAEVYRRALRVCGGLQRLGVRPGDRVALIFPTGPEFFDGYFGAILAGVVPCPLYPPVRLGRIDEYHRRTAAMLVAAGAVVVLVAVGLVTRRQWQGRL